MATGHHPCGDEFQCLVRNVPTKFGVVVERDDADARIIEQLWDLEMVYPTAPFKLFRQAQLVYQFLHLAFDGRLSRVAHDKNLEPRASIAHPSHGTDDVEKPPGRVHRADDANIVLALGHGGPSTGKCLVGATL